MMSLTIAFGASPRSKAARACAQAAALSFSALPSTRSASAMATKVCGSVCAAQPVTTIFACGRSRRSARIAWPRLAHRFGGDRAGIDHDGVVKPARSASRRITSDSAALSRQPKVTTSTLIDAALRAASANKAASKRPLCSYSTGPVISTWSSLSRHSMARSPPGKVTVTLRPVRLEPRRGNRGGAGRRAARLGEAGAALPGADHDAVARRRRGERDIGALRKDRVGVRAAGRCWRDRSAADRRPRKSHADCPC